MGLAFCKIDYRRNGCSNNDPEELKPVEKRDASELRIAEVVKRGPEQDDKGQNEDQAQPVSFLAFRLINHTVISFIMVESYIGCVILENGWLF
jgi:hypothetical protein